MKELQIGTATAIARVALRFGQVRRVTQHEDGEKESDTTHTVMLALLAMEMAIVVGYDPGLAAMFALVHDLPEAYAGDTNTARQLTTCAAAEKASREAAATVQLAADLGDVHALSLLRRYEVQQEPEARLVRYLDKVVPKLTHYLNRGAALQALGFSVGEVHSNHERQGESLAAQYPELDAVRRLFIDSCQQVIPAIEMACSASTTS